MLKLVSAPENPLPHLLPIRSLSTPASAPYPIRSLSSIYLSIYHMWQICHRSVYPSQMGADAGADSRERIQERIDRNISHVICLSQSDVLNLSHDKWERIGSGYGSRFSGADSREWILSNFSKSDWFREVTHDLVSSPMT